MRFVPFALLALTGCSVVPRANLQLKQAASPTVTVNFAYDIDGQPVNVTTTDGFAIDLVWNDGKLETAAGAALEYDGEGRFVRLDRGAIVNTLEYDEAGRILKITNNLDLGGGATETSTRSFAYDAEGSLAQEVLDTTTTPTKGDPIISAVTTTRSFEEGRLVQSIVVSGDVSKTTDVSYDESGRPIALVDPDGTLTLTYDDFGGGALLTSARGDDVIEYIYGVGAARGLDMTPDVLFGFWDTKGTAYDTLDATTLPRLLAGFFP